MDDMYNIEITGVEKAVIRVRFDILLDQCKSCPVYKLNDSVDLGKVRNIPCGGGCLFPYYVSIREKFKI